MSKAKLVDEIGQYDNVPDEPGVHYMTFAIRNPKGKPPIPEALRWEIWERDNFTCQHCGRRRYLAIDHIIPESKGGPTVFSNLQTLCRWCNSKKKTRIV